LCVSPLDTDASECGAKLIGQSLLLFRCHYSTFCVVGQHAWSPHLAFSVTTCYVDIGHIMSCAGQHTQKAQTSFFGRPDVIH
jgi:hypothetical protein